VFFKRLLFCKTIINKLIGARVREQLEEKNVRWVVMRRGPRTTQSGKKGPELLWEEVREQLNQEKRAMSCYEKWSENNSTREKGPRVVMRKGPENNSMRKKHELEFFSILPRGKRAILSSIQQHSKSNNVYDNSFLKRTILGKVKEKWKYAGKWTCILTIYILFSLPFIFCGQSSAAAVPAIFL